MLFLDDLKKNCLMFVVVPVVFKVRCDVYSIVVRPVFKISAGGGGKNPNSGLLEGGGGAPNCRPILLVY